MASLSYWQHTGSLCTCGLLVWHILTFFNDLMVKNAVYCIYGSVRHNVLNVVVSVVDCDNFIVVISTGFAVGILYLLFVFFVD